MARAPGVRAEAARSLVRLYRGGTVEAEIERTSVTDPRDRALLRALISGALRWHHRYAWVVDQLSRSRRRPDPVVTALLHLGLLQLDELRVPDHAAVGETVNAAAELGVGHARGFVNAVLRRFLRERDALVARDEPVYNHSHPRWLADAFIRDWGPADGAALLAADNETPPQWLRVNLLRSSRAAYIAELNAAGIDAESGAASPATVRLGSPVPVAELPGHAEGLVAVQDAAAQLAAGLLDLAPGQRVLDACAAPGGKTAHMLESCPGLAAVVAVDVDADRLAGVGTALTRLGHDARLVVGDAMSPDDWWDGRSFDRILLDAPCSGTGVIRRHPEIKLRRRPADVGAAARQQARLLDALWPLLAPGGRLVYATCSVLSAENAAQTAAFLDRRDDAGCAPPGTPGHFRIRTGAAGMDGFYYACLDKNRGR